jgi:alpha-amylase/alpha-mannosidase (GH57 family)
MHQPEYRDAETGYYRVPWTYLHGIKDSMVTCFIRMKYSLITKA